MSIVSVNAGSIISVSVIVSVTEISLAGLQVFKVVVQTDVACLSAPRVSTYCYPEFHVGEVFPGG